MIIVRCSISAHGPRSSTRRTSSPKVCEGRCKTRQSQARSHDYLTKFKSPQILPWGGVVFPRSDPSGPFRYCPIVLYHHVGETSSSCYWRFQVRIIQKSFLILLSYLRGIGLAVTKFLLDKFQARVVSLARSKVPIESEDLLSIECDVQVFVWNSDSSRIYLSAAPMKPR